jgi:hypothetical protein
MDHFKVRAMKAYVNIGANTNSSSPKQSLFIGVEAMAPSRACTKSSKVRMEFLISPPVKP